MSDYQFELFDENGELSWESGARSMPPAQELLDSTAYSAGVAPDHRTSEFAVGASPESREPQPQLGDAAPLTVRPTSTTNPERPRTLAAGYEPRTKTITVLFRDGTLYNYYDCSQSTWDGFRSTVSKGVYIKRFLDSHNRGEASATDTEQLIASLYASPALVNRSTISRARNADGGLPSTIQFGKNEKFGRNVAPSRYRTEVMRLIAEGKTATQAVQMANKTILPGRRKK